MPIERAVVTIVYDDGTSEDLAAEPVAAANSTRVFDFWLATLKEAADGYRYFGNLRALITWFPAVIMFTVLTGIENRFTEGWPQYLPGLVLAVVFLLIYFAQRRLEKYQRKCRAIANEAAEAYRRVSNGETVPIRTYEEMRTATPTPSSGLFGDRPSQILLGFFVVVLAYSVLMSNCTVSAWLGPTASCPVDAGADPLAPPDTPPDG